VKIEKRTTPSKVSLQYKPEPSPQDQALNNHCNHHPKILADLFNKAHFSQVARRHGNVIMYLTMSLGGAKNGCKKGARHCALSIERHLWCLTTSEEYFEVSVQKIGPLIL
jgi:hypothetical protein